jgi:hypothetical protein
MERNGHDMGKRLNLKNGGNYPKWGKKLKKKMNRVLGTC